MVKSPALALLPTLPVGSWAATRTRRVPEGVLDVEAARRVLDDHVAGRTERGRTLWTLLSLQMWAERWVAGSGPGG